MRILVVGGWKPEKTIDYLDKAEELGKEIAGRGHTLVTSPSSGIQGIVAKHYKESGGREFIGYYPKQSLMQAIGEDVMIEPDIPVYTDAIYAIRNIRQIEGSDAAIGLTGGSRTLVELITAIRDFSLPTAFYAGSDSKVDQYRGIDPKFKDKLIYGKSIPDLLDSLESS
jgi:predicted Rossmann-fold nucleotide-binding protein